MSISIITESGAKRVEVFQTYMHKTDGTIGKVDIVSTRYIYLTGKNGEDLGAHTPAALGEFWNLCVLCPLCDNPYPEDEGTIVEFDDGGPSTICQSCYEAGPPEPITRAASPRGR